ncbi:MAG TPA: monovalent cation/H(+) antiporter subunit G [Actinomycetes bacterium]
MMAWLADALLLLGLAVMTLGVYGIVRFPDVYTQLHASSKAAFLGVSLLLVATALGGGPSIYARVVLIVALLSITTPVAAHAIAQAAYHQREPMHAPSAVDESGTMPLPTATPPRQSDPEGRTGP